MSHLYSFSLLTCHSIGIFKGGFTVQTPPNKVIAVIANWKQKNMIIPNGKKTIYDYTQKYDHTLAPNGKIWPYMTIPKNMTILWYQMEKYDQTQWKPSKTEPPKLLLGHALVWLLVSLTHEWHFDWCVLFMVFRHNLSVGTVVWWVRALAVNAGILLIVIFCSTPSVILNQLNRIENFKSETEVDIFHLSYGGAT